MFGFSFIISACIIDAFFRALDAFYLSVRRALLYLAPEELRLQSGVCCCRWPSGHTQVSQYLQRLNNSNSIH